MFKQISSIIMAGTILTAGCHLQWAPSGDSPNPQRIETLSRSCEAGDADRCYQLGFLYEHGQGVRASAFQSRIYYKQACKLGLSGACKDPGAPVKAPVLAEQDKIDSCQAGQTEACDELIERGIAYVKEKHDTATALQLFMPACLQKRSAACFNVGVLLEESKPVEALQAFAGACQLGSGEGCFKSAGMLLRLGTGESFKKGMDLLLKSCSLNFAEGCANYGRILQKICDEASSGPVCAQYSQWLTLGKSGRPDFDAAQRYATKACRLGPPAACRMAREALP